MAIRSILKILLCFLPIGLFGSEKLILDTTSPSTVMPQHFRKMNDPFSHANKKKRPSREGLSTLRASGSGQYSKKGFKKVLKQLKGPKQLIFLDVRLESHGFMNDNAVSWYSKHDLANLGKNFDEVQLDEAYRLERGRHIRYQRYFYGDPVGKKKKKIKVKQVCTEEMLARQNKVYYRRLLSPDNSKPTVDNVEHFIGLVKFMPKGSWLHIHCREGMARTTTYLAMYDMMMNAKKVSLQDIILRQKLLGGMDLMRKPHAHSWTAKNYKKRSAFMRRFYNYCKAQSPHFTTSWTDWCKKKKWSDP